jgi:hypothetical protein
MGDSGWCSRSSRARTLRSSFLSSPGNTELSMKSPWFTRFCDEIALPSGVMGPRDRLPLALDALILASELIVDLDYAGGFGRREVSGLVGFLVSVFESLGYGLENLFHIFVTGFLEGVRGGVFNAEARRRRGTRRKRFGWGCYSFSPRTRLTIPSRNWGTLKLMRRPAFHAPRRR